MALLLSVPLVAIERSVVSAGTTESGRHLIRERSVWGLSLIKIQCNEDLEGKSAEEAKSAMTFGVNCEPLPDSFDKDYRKTTQLRAVHYGTGMRDAEMVAGSSANR